jgi:hypothetical protein
MLARQVSRNKINAVMGIFHTENTQKAFISILQKTPQLLPDTAIQRYFPYLCSSETLNKEFPEVMEGAICIDALAISEMSSLGQQRLATYKETHSISSIEGRIPFYKESIDLL